MKPGTPKHAYTADRVRFSPITLWLMNARLVVSIGLGVLLICAGCKCVPHSPQASDTPKFSEEEIRSKTWKDSTGEAMACLEWQITELKSRGGFLVAQFGSPHTKFPKCLEFYRVISSQGGYCGAAGDVGQASLSEGMSLSEKKMFVLVGRDCAESVVRSAEVLESNDSASVAITRETPPDQKTGRQRALYLVKYTKDYGMWRDVHTWISNLPDSE
jgi:hypothetical protein